MNGFIIGAIVAGAIGGVAGGLKIAEYSYVYYHWRQQVKSIEQNKKLREEFKQRLLDYILEHPDQIDLNYLVELLLSNNPEDTKKAKKYLLDRGLISEEVELIRH